MFYNVTKNKQKKERKERSEIFNDLNFFFSFYLKVNKNVSNSKNKSRN